MKHRGVICDKCGVEVTLSKVAGNASANRAGVALLARLVLQSLPRAWATCWTFPCATSNAFCTLKATSSSIRRCSGHQEREMLPEEKYRELQKDFAGKFRAQMGAEAIKELLKRVEVESFPKRCARNEGRPELQKRIKYAKRLKVLESFRKSGNKPEWMIFGRFFRPAAGVASARALDGALRHFRLNDLYRRAFNRTTA